VEGREVLRGDLNRPRIDGIQLGQGLIRGIKEPL
jgi:hypothetical protein